MHNAQCKMHLLLTCNNFKLSENVLQSHFLQFVFFNSETDQEEKVEESESVKEEGEKATKPPEETRLEKLMTDLRKKEKESQLPNGKITLDEAIEQEINIQVYISIFLMMKTYPYSVYFNVIF